MTEKNTNDAVSQERWQEAQKWELNHWVQAQAARSRFGKNYIWKIASSLGLLPRYRGEDWNAWWREKFDGYRFLPAKVKNAIEVGCGPYTNVRLMMDCCQMEHLVLSDPLIRTYAKFKLTFVNDMYRKVACILDDHPIEELPFADGNFDLTVMINVLDHVRDAQECMRQLTRVTKPGGIVIVGQDLSNEEDLAAMAGTEGETGHPIKLDADWFNQHLTGAFEPILHKVLSREEGRAAAHHYGTLLFAGRRRG